MQKHLVLAGGGHAHLTMLARCRDFVDLGVRVTVVSASPYHYYSGMGPGLLAGAYRPQDVRFNIRKTVTDRGAEFIEGRVAAIDPGRRMLRLGPGREIGYDIVSFNTGSDVVLPPGAEAGENIFSVKPVSSLLDARRSIIAALKKGPARIVVIGGGPAGVEIAGNAWRLVENEGGRAQITLIAGKQLLSGGPERLRYAARSSLLGRGISIRGGCHAEKFEKDEVVLTTGERLRADVVLAASGISPSSVFKDSGLPVGPDNGLLVDRFLRCGSYPEIFGGGDAICFAPRPLAKVGVYAVRQNMVLFRNVMSALGAGGLVPFEPRKKYMLIFNMGNDRGILWRGRLVWSGRLPWRLKDWIDRSFMHKYQISGERNEGTEEEKNGHS